MLRNWSLHWQHNHTDSQLCAEWFKRRSIVLMLRHQWSIFIDASSLNTNDGDKSDLPGDSFLPFLDVSQNHCALKPPSAGYLPVNVVLDAEQVVGHRLQCELMQQRWYRIKATIQDEQLSTRFIWTLEASEHTFMFVISFESAILSNMPS